MLTKSKGKSTHYDGVINVGEIGDRQLSHNHSGEVNRSLRHQTIEWVVSGVVMSFETNTELGFEKRFDSEESATAYRDKMIIHFPLSEVLIRSETVTEISIYS